MGLHDSEIDAECAEEVAALVRAVSQVLDDMREDGLSCCGLAKAQLRIAYEPFRTDDDVGLMTLPEANKIVAACEY